MLKRIQSLRLIDDDFMSVVFNGDNEITEKSLKDGTYSEKIAELSELPVKR